jgi:hypothetical protein
MIFRDNNSSVQSEPSPLQRIQAHIENDSALRLCIFDAIEDDGALIVFCTEQPMAKIIKLTLQNHWPGKIEVYCPSSMLTGAKISSDQYCQEMDKSVQYIN